MIRGSLGWGMAALVGAVAIHAVLGWALMTRTDVEIENGAGAPEAQIGTSFADMAVGTLEATGAEEAAEPLEPKEAETPDTVQPETTEPMQPEAAEPVKAQPAQAEPPEATEPSRDVTEPAGDAVPTVAALAPEPVTAPAPPVEEAEPITSGIVKDVIEAEETPTVSRSLRPRRRSEEFKKKNEQVAKKAAPKPKPKKTPQPKKQPRGNAKQNNKAGAATGSAKAKAKTSGAGQGSAAASGNAAASNYPGLVMQRLSRVPRPRAGSRGTVVVAFSVSGGGRLAGVSIARSSGSGALDRAAMNMVRRAAPFPAPPPGARRGFSINIKGR